MEKKKMTTGSVMKIVVFSLIGIFIIIAVVSDLWLSTTAFGNFVNNTIGKFFNIVGLVVNHTMSIVESLVIIVFFWLLNKLFEYLVMPLVKKRNNRLTILGDYKKYI